MLNCINKDMTSRDREVIVPTQCLSGHAWNTMPSFSSHYKKMMWTIWRGSRAGHKDDQRAGELLYEER